jgi:hypothetical protein
MMGDDTARRVYPFSAQSGYFALIAFRLVVPSVILNDSASLKVSERFAGLLPPTMETPSRTST